MMVRFGRTGSKVKQSDRPPLSVNGKSLRVSPSMEQFRLRSDSTDSIAGTTVSDSEFAHLMPRPQTLLPQ